MLQTLRKLGTKGKAHSWDNVADCIFSRRALMRVRWNGLSLQQFAGEEDDHENARQKEVRGHRKVQVKNKRAICDFVTMVELKLAGKLTDLYNYLLREDLPLPAKQNLIRQIYLPKTSAVY